MKNTITSLALAASLFAGVALATTPEETTDGTEVPGEDTTEPSGEPTEPPTEATEPTEEPTEEPESEPTEEEFFKEGIHDGYVDCHPYEVVRRDAHAGCQTCGNAAEINKTSCQKICSGL